MTTPNPTPARIAEIRRLANDDTFNEHHSRGAIRDLLAHIRHQEEAITHLQKANEGMSASCARSDAHIERLEEAITKAIPVFERCINAIGAAFGKPQRDHIKAEGMKALAALSGDNKEEAKTL